MPLAAAGLFGWLALNLVVVPSLIPPTASVSAEEIRYSHGELGWIAKREDCSCFELVVFSQRLRRLRFRHKGKRRALGLAASVDANSLRSLLSCPMKTTDATKRFGFARSIGEQ
jgi:hypothetical protein